MENTDKGAAQNAAPQNDWQNAERDALVNADPTQNDDFRSAEANGYGAEDERLFATESDREPDEDEEDEEEEAGDWGHVDPAETNSPFPDSNDPSGPGSAV